MWGLLALQEQVSHCSLGFDITHSVPCPFNVPFSISLWRQAPDLCLHITAFGYLEIHDWFDTTLPRLGLGSRHGLSSHWPEVGCTRDSPHLRAAASDSIGMQWDRRLGMQGAQFGHMCLRCLLLVPLQLVDSVWG